MFSQLPELLSLCPPPLIHLHDPHQQLLHSSDLKSIRRAQNAFISIDCIECISQRVLFTRVINGLANWVPEWRDHGGECWGGQGLGAWDASFDAFALAYRALWQSLLDSKARNGSTSGGNDAIVIMLLNSERLKDFLPSLFVPFTRLSELTGVPSCVVLVSQCSWLSLRPPMGSSPTPLLFNVPPLTDTQIIDRLFSRFPSQRPKHPIHPYNLRLKPLYDQFVKALYSTCSPTTNDPDQLAYIAAARWPGFVEPLLNDWRAIEDSLPIPAEEKNNIAELDANAEESRYPPPSNEDTMRLLHTFMPTFLPALNALLPRLTTAQAWAAANMPPSSVRLSNPLSLSLPGGYKSSSASELLSGVGAVEQAEARLKGLTTRTRILLLASYVASFNPARTDARLFERTAQGVAKRAKRKKRGNGTVSPRKTPGKASAASKLSRALTGPAAFPLDRLLAIYESLLIEHIGDELDLLDDDARNLAMDEWGKEVGRVHLISTISQLVQTQLLQRTSAASSVSEVFDGSTQFKSNVSHDLALRIAKGLKVELGDILWDVDRV